jgi:hypothetical protein
MNHVASLLCSRRRIFYDVKLNEGLTTLGGHDDAPHRSSPSLFRPRPSRLVAGVAACSSTTESNADGGAPAPSTAGNVPGAPDAAPSDGATSAEKLVECSLGRVRSLGNTSACSILGYPPTVSSAESIAAGIPTLGEVSRPPHVRRRRFVHPRLAGEVELPTGFTGQWVLPLADGGCRSRALGRSRRFGARRTPRRDRPVRPGAHASRERSAVDDALQSAVSIVRRWLLHVARPCRDRGADFVIARGGELPETTEAGKSRFIADAPAIRMATSTCS